LHARLEIVTHAHRDDDLESPLEEERHVWAAHHAFCALPGDLRRRDDEFGEHGVGHVAEKGHEVLAHKVEVARARARVQHHELESVVKHNREGEVLVRADYDKRHICCAEPLTVDLALQSVDPNDLVGGVLLLLVGDGEEISRSEVCVERSETLAKPPENNRAER
jgi:hypothetical protein